MCGGVRAVVVIVCVCADCGQNLHNAAQCLEPMERQHPGRQVTMYLERAHQNAGASWQCAMML